MIEFNYVSPADRGAHSSANCVSDGEPIKLPENLESLPKADHFPTQRHRWNTNEVSELSL